MEELQGGAVQALQLLPMRKLQQTLRLLLPSNVTTIAVWIAVIDAMTVLGLMRVGRNVCRSFVLQISHRARNRTEILKEAPAIMRVMSVGQQEIQGILQEQLVI